MSLMLNLHWLLRVTLVLKVLHRFHLVPHMQQALSLNEDPCESRSF